MGSLKAKILTVKPIVAVVLAALLLVSSCSSIFAAGLSTAQPVLDQPLPGYVPAGPAPSDLTVSVDIAIPLRNVGLLSSMVKEVSDPSSPSFGCFLTPAQIEQEFLPVGQYKAMLAYLESAGLQVVAEALDSVIVVQATAAQVKQYFDADVNMYTNGTCSYYITTGNSEFHGARFIASNATALMVKPKLAGISPAEQTVNVTYTKSGLSAKDLPEVYNATVLYEQGFQGENQTIGILDFYGSPTVYEDLEIFNALYGFPSATLNVIPIGPYNPNLGAYKGWSTEVSLDVQMAHAMAPAATLDLYVATGARSVASDIAQIVSLNRITTLSMSLSFAHEWNYYTISAEWFYFNMFLPDLYFMLGSLQGITFLSSSGDGGGSGFSSGTSGNSAFPSNSAYVTSVGGTQTYIYTQPNGSQASVQTAWSNRAYVPDGFNAGGGGGGVSFMQPKPWYQQSQQTPPSYPNGRMEPDLSLQGGIFPGINIIDAGSVRITGGTSASAPILAGFVALMAQSSGRPLGLINPFLYSLGNNETLYTKAFTPVTFGYIIPWTASYGYNLAAGWGAPNIGEIAAFYKTQPSQASLSVEVGLVDSNGQYPLEVFPDQTIQVTAQIANGNTTVTNGEFTAKLVTLADTSLVTPMVFDSANQVWACSVTMGQQAGVAYFDVAGTSEGVSGEGVAETYVGYFATFYNPTPTDPWTTAHGGLQVIVASTDLAGNPAPTDPTLSMQIKSYSILDNAYTTVDTVALSPTNDSQRGLVSTVNLTDPYPAGPLTLMIQEGTYGILPFTNGIYLQSTVMYPEVAAEPGSLAPGQYLTIVASPKAPVNVADIFSYDSGGTIGSDIAAGSSVVALLVNSSGETVANSSLVYQNAKIRGTLQVPENASSGLYTILLGASYESATLQATLYGWFFGQVWVSDGMTTPQITVSPSTLYMGQTAQISVDIRYPDGQEVTFGQYTLVVYPQQMQDQYAQITYAGYIDAKLTPLTYNPTLNRWTANITLPSPYDAGVISFLNGSSLDYAGPYAAYVTGLAYDGVPTTAALSAQKGFLIQPYVYVENQVLSSTQQSWGLALNGVTIAGSADLSNNVFVESNYVQASTATISDSVINGTLYVTDSNLTLRGVHGGNIVAVNSSLNLINSDVAAITTTNSELSLTSSSYGAIDPAPPTIQILSPANAGSYEGNLALTVSVLGSDVDSVVVTLNGQLIQTFSGNGTHSFTLQSAGYPDGTYFMEVTATQTNSVSASANRTMQFVNQASSLFSDLAALNATQIALQNQINSLQNNLNNMSLTQSALQKQLFDLESQLKDLENNLTNDINILNLEQSSLQNQLGSLSEKLNSLNSSQSALQNQLNDLGGNLTSNIDNLNSTQSALQNQLDNLGTDLNTSLDTLHNQITDLNSNLQNAEYIAFAGIAVGIAGVIIAVSVALNKRSKKSPS
ncbi:MAG: protease pro-enzyme activation domain-containing protein [Candidatus Bathyarchaeota archaeon]|nr:protease pro-enzyme activation domain-containing protein [Candidatus Bathyarchaeota archaeon]